MIRIIVLVSFTLSLAACQPEGRVYNEHKELSPEFRWSQIDTREFEVPIDDTSIPYNLTLSFRFINGYQYNAAKVSVIETSPSGKETVNEYTLKVRDDKGEYIGEAGYDIWDSEHLVEANKKYEETGIYTYTLAHSMPDDPLLNVMDIGVILDKAK